jgi:hypothetical protein
MNNWNFNELTQEDILDYKACQRKDKSIYGIPDKSECTKGKEIKTEDLQKLAKAANAGDPKAKAQINQYKKVQAEQKDKERAGKKAEKEAAAKKKENEKVAKCKSGELKGKECKGIKKEKGGGKGKKGGGKGKGGKGKAGGKGGGKGAGKAKGGKGGGAAAKSGGKSQLQANAKKAQQQAQKQRNARAREIRSKISELQKNLRQIKNPEVRKALEQQISDALRSVSDLAKGKSPTPSPGTPAKPGSPAKPGAPSAPLPGGAAGGAAGIGAAA